MTTADPLPRSLSVLRIARIKKVLFVWFDIHGRDLPWRHTRDPYAILVAEVMLQQTQVARVVPKYHEFLGLFPTFTELARADVAEVIRAWATLGYNVRAVRLHALAVQVVREHGGRLPADLLVLRRLKGIGLYTIAALRCFAFGQDEVVLDTNIRRVLSRVFYGQSRPSEIALRATALKVLPLGQAWFWNQALMDLGATICTARKPRCEVCPVRADCQNRLVIHKGQPVALVGSASRYQSGKLPYRGSRRYYRGRVVDYLRRMPPGMTASIRDVGKAIRVNLTLKTMPWLEGILVGLERDGLVAFKGDIHGGSETGLAEEKSFASLRVGLPGP